MLRIIITLVIHYGWDLRQYDVTNAFLHGDIEEEIYMDIPSGFKGDFAAEKVCWLKKALYGLKQSPDHGLEDLQRLGYLWDTTKEGQIQPCL